MPNKVSRNTCCFHHIAVFANDMIYFLGLAVLFVTLSMLPLSSAEPYEFLVKLRNITWETNYVIVSQNALGMMGRRKLRKALPSELNLFTWNDNIQSFGS